MIAQLSDYNFFVLMLTNPLENAHLSGCTIFFCFDANKSHKKMNSSHNLEL